MRTETDIPQRDTLESRMAQPRFTVGRDRHGWWIVSDALDQLGGLFASREAALHFAAQESDHALGAVRCLADNVILKFGLSGKRTRAVAQNPLRKKSA